MNWSYFGILLAFGFWTLPAPSQAFIARSTGCHHNGTWYADKSLVPTVEKCLNCQCNKKTLVCRLKVCPEMPMPPPRGCVVVQKKNTCCPYLSCARLEAFYKIPITRRIIAYLDHYERESIDRVVNDNMLQRRSDDSEADLLVCVKNGTVYKSGSAMSSSNLCSYCYCIGGTEKCVKPKCMLPVEGCKPIFVDSTCCPVRYDCSAKTSGKSSQEVRYRKTANKHFLRMSQRLQRNRGCTVNKQFYAEGQKMKSDLDKPCDICFCIRGSRRCAPKKCSPALKNCIPVVPKGQCCPSSYDCGSQRDHRRSYNSRQFNLFSLLFGKDENKSGPSTAIPAQYPHDRDPALTSGVSKYKTPQLALEASSEKSILDTIREGLEYIDGNTNHMLEENLDLVNLQAKRESVKAVDSTTSTAPVKEISSPTEMSFLDLILSESSDVPNRDEHIAVSQPSTPVQDELSWVDILLGSNDEQQNKTHAIAEENTSNNHLTTTPINIDRLDTDVEELGSSGEIFAGTTESLMETTTQATITLSGLKPSTPENNVKVESTEMPMVSLKPESNVSIKLFTNKTEVAEKMPVESTTSPIKLTNPIIKPIPLYNLGEDFQKMEHMPLKVSKPNDTITTITTPKPTKPNDLLTALLDGISGILGSEKANNITSPTDTQDTQSTQTTLRPTKQPPVFKPLPIQKTHTHTRINSKIANLVVSPPTLMFNNSQTRNSTFKPLPSKLKDNTRTSTTTSTSTTSTTTSTTTTTTTTSTTQKPTITTTVTTSKPFIIKTNPTILEAEPLDDSTEPTLPPSLPNLKIIPFLPTDAVEAANTKIYEYFPGSAPLYDDPKLYPDISKHYASYAVDLEDDNKAKYIYKFKVEGPEADSMSQAIPKTPTDALSGESFLKYEFVEKNGFSPPTKTEGGFVPKEPLPIDDEILINGEFNTTRLNEIFPATMHIIDITTPEPFTENLTKIIEITTPDPFKDVIHTEPPPDLAIIIQDKAKIEAMAQKLSNTSTQLSETPLFQSSDLHNLTKPVQPNIVASPTEISLTTPTIEKENNSIETFLDMFFKEEQETAPQVPTKSSSTTSTIPPFKNLPQTTVDLLSIKPTTTSSIKRLESTTISSQTTRRPLRTKATQPLGTKNRTKFNATRRPTATSPPKDNKLKINKTIPTTKKASTITSTPISLAIKTTNLPVSSPKPTKSILSTTTVASPSSAASIITTTTHATSTKTSHNPFLMSPFDKLPFMDASFEIKRQTTPTAPPILTSTIISHSLERLEGLDAAYEISNAISSTTPTTTMHPPFVPVSGEHSVSTSNSLIDPTGILKLAGCNIYGRMYRVGRIILELSSPCVECKCTETGVKCGQLDC